MCDLWIASASRWLLFDSLVGYVPGFPGARSQGDGVEELKINLREVIEMLLEDGDPPFESKFIGTQTIHVA